MHIRFIRSLIPGPLYIISTDQVLSAAKGDFSMKEYDIVIIGGGPGGYSAAVRARQLGLSVALAEKENIGGVFVNWGCIPTKTLLKYAKLRHKFESHESDAWKMPPQYKNAQEKSAKVARERRECIQQLLVNDGVELFKGTAHLAGAGIVEIQPSGETLKGKNVIISTGSRPRRIPVFDYDGINIITTREALELTDAPSSAVIVGSGATGIEFATVWSSFGTKVTVLEILPYIMGSDDEGVVRAAVDYFSNNGVEIKTSVNVENIRNTPKGVEVTFTKDGKQEQLIVEKAMIGAGVVPNSEDLGLEALGVETERGYIKIDSKMRTNIPGIYAVGDVTGKLALAMTATLQAMTAAETIAGNKTEEIDYSNIARCIYAGIQVAAVGLCEKAAKELGYDVVSVTAPVTPFVKTINFKEADGFVNLSVRTSDNTVLGALMIGSDVTDQIAIPARMISLGSTAQEIIGALSNGR